jgi:uncharacterized protein (DUF169 family)
MGSFSSSQGSPKKIMTTDLAHLESALTKYVRPGTFPAAIRMIRRGEPLPEQVRHPLKDLKIQVATCQAISIARRYGWVVALGNEDLSCPLTAVAFGFRKPGEFYLTGLACAGMYTESAEAGIRSEEGVAKLAYGEYEHILIAPIQRASFQPHVVLVFGNAAQVLRLLTAALWKSGGRLASSFGGRIDCSEEIIVPMRSGKCEVILPCYGDRIYAQTQDHEMAFAIPFNRIPEIVDGLEGTHKGGVRYPIPSFLRYTGEFPPQYAKVADRD